MRRFRGATLILLLVGGGWLLTTNNVQIFPARNTLQYYLLHQWWQWMGYPESTGSGELAGTLQDETLQPIANAVVLATRWDGTAFHTRTDEVGHYVLEEVPGGYYAVVAGAKGFRPTILDTLNIRANDPITLSATLENAPIIQAPLLTETPTPLWQGVEAGEMLNCEKPVVATATRRTFTIRPNQNPAYPFYLYTPTTATENSQLPVLVTLYPGPAESWDCVSLPLAQAGYAVISFGTQHRLDLEEDVNLLKQLVADYLREGLIPNTDPSRMVILGGSYSAIHAQRLLQDEPDFRAGILLGAPTDLFDMRRRFEQEGFVPPYGLDAAFRALGFPDREPLRYWQYSAAYHVHADMPPLLLVHSRADEIVPYPQSTLLAEQLDAVGVPYELHFFDGASHYLLEGDSDALQIYELTLRFLEEALQ